MENLTKVTVFAHNGKKIKTWIVDTDLDGLVLDGRHINFVCDGNRVMVTNAIVIVEEKPQKE